MGPRLLNREHLAAMTAESLADRQGRSVVLSFTLWTGDEKTHEMRSTGGKCEVGSAMALLL